MCTLTSVTNYKTNTELMGLSSIESFWEFLSVCSSYKEIQATDAVRSVLDILNRLGTLLEKAIEKPEKNVNLLEILWADENANSRILGALFERKNKGRYEILQSFIDTFFADSSSIKIEKPEFFNELHRIDLLVKDKNYCIIFENKIHGAVLQKNQIARYINSMKEDGYNDEQIFVVFLPPTSSYEPSLCSWLSPGDKCDKCNGETNDNCYELTNYQYEYDARYSNVSFKEGILPWLKKDVLPECKISDMILFSALTQYVDFLEGLYGLRSNNNELKMEIKEKIKEMLQLGDNEFANHDTIKNKLKELQQVQDYLIEIENETHEECFQKLEAVMRTEFPNLIMKQHPSNRWRSFSIRVPVRNHSVVVMCEENVNTRSTYYGLVCPKEEDKEKLKEVLNDIISHYMNMSGFRKSTTWYFYKYAKFADMSDCLIGLIKYIEAQG